MTAEFGPQTFKSSSFSIDNNKIPHTNSLKYLGVTIDNTLDFNKYSINKFNSVQKSIFSLFLRLSPNNLTPHLQAFIYKIYCLFQFTYGLETSVLNEKTREYLNICQNNIIRHILRINKFCHMSNIWKYLKIFKFEDLYTFSKLCFKYSLKKTM